MLPGKGAPSAVVGTVRIDDVGITHALDWKRVPQVRLCVCGGGMSGRAGDGGQVAERLISRKVRSSYIAAARLGLRDQPRVRAGT